MSKPIVMERGVKYRDADKMALIPVKNVATEREALLRKPEWMKIKLPADSTRIQGIKAAMRKNGLHSVCEEASCPNLAECFNHGTATFMILGAICTRRCPFCDVAHGRPVAPDANEPVKLAQTIADMALRYVVITSVDRDDLREPEWMKIKLPADSTRIQGIKAAMRKNGLHSVCEEASCPNLAECFNHGTATFMILGAICTRRCPFCDVAHGRPVAPDANEPVKLAQTIADMALRYVVITSVDRDDLRDGGAQHFADCITAIREKSPQIKIETLVPDFRGRMDRALDILTATPPDVFNHNLENVPRIYRQVRPGADYNWSLKLLERFKEAHPEIPTKSGLMVGLGETNEEIIEVMRDLRRHGVTMLTLGQYLQPSRHHLPVQRYVSPDEFDEMKAEALAMGFTHAACGPFVRSSYHADLQAKGMEVK